MNDAEGLAAWAALLADRTRAAFCLALLDGRAWTVGELGRHAGVALSTASEHADRLVAGGLLIQHRQGRHRYLSLAGPDVAALIETVAAVSPPRTAATPPRSMAAAHRQRNLAHARTCYDHLAGRLGVALADALTEAKLVSRDGGLSVTDDGRRRLAELGIALDGTGPDGTAVAGGKRPIVRDCLDWTERRPHLAGVLGAAICRHAFDEGWIVRIGSGRAVKVTAAGEAAFADRLGVSVAEPGEPGASPAAPGAAHHR